jgi:hypothetical protein
MKVTRRRRGSSMDFDGMEVASSVIDQYEDSIANEEREGSGEDAGNVLSSDEDIDGPAPKRARHSQ